MLKYDSYLYCRSFLAMSTLSEFLRQCVRLDGKVGASVDVISVVPQGKYFRAVVVVIIIIIIIKITRHIKLG